jgi:hypothetical protein
VRFIIHLVLVGAFGLALLSIVLSRRTPLGLTALALVVAALLLGGFQVDRSSSSSRGVRSACSARPGRPTWRISR